jgi:DNA-directed RNA polymerase beta' subunit
MGVYEVDEADEADEDAAKYVNLRCGTCNRKKTCRGHYGHIQLCKLVDNLDRLPVPPPSMGRFIRFMKKGVGGRSDDMTAQIVDIVRLNNMMRFEANFIPHDAS